MKQYLYHMMTSAMLFAGAGAAGAVGLPAPGAVTPQTRWLVAIAGTERSRCDPDP